MENFLGLTLFQTITWLLNGRPLDLHRRPDLSDLLRITDDDGDSSVLRFSPFPPSRFTPAVHSGAVACVAEDERQGTIRSLETREPSTTTARSATI